MHVSFRVHEAKVDGHGIKNYVDEPVVALPTKRTYHQAECGHFGKCGQLNLGDLRRGGETSQIQKPIVNDGAAECGMGCEVR